MVATGIVALSGGFRREGGAGGKLAISGPGIPIESDAFVVKPLCAWASDRRPGQPASAAGDQRYLILRATVVSKARNWVAMRAYLDKDIVWLPGGRGAPLPAERSQRADDAALRFDLGPGLPVQVDFVWELPAGTSPPTTTATWGVFKRRHVERSQASGESMWVQDGPGWKVEVPVSMSCPGGAA